MEIVCNIIENIDGTGHVVCVSATPAYANGVKVETADLASTLCLGVTNVCDEIINKVTIGKDGK